MSVTDAQDSTLAQPSAQIANSTLDSRTNVDTPAQVSVNRTTQQRVLPTAVQSHTQVQANILQGLFDNNPESLLGGQFTWFFLPDSFQGTINITTTNNQNQELVGIITQTFYIGVSGEGLSPLQFDTFAADNASSSYPNNNYNLLNMGVAFWTDWGASDGNNLINKASIANYSGTDVMVTHAFRSRLLINPAVSAING